MSSVCQFGKSRPDSFGQFEPNGFDDVTVPSDGADMPRWVCNDPPRKVLMSEITTVGLDLAKTVFQVHGAGGAGQVTLRKKLRRDQAERVVVRDLRQRRFEPNI
jgi:hypothetical protein